MLKEAMSTYLSLRRAAGYQLKTGKWYLRSFTDFATRRGDTHVLSQTAIDWARAASSEVQRANRLKEVIRFARFVHAEDPRHEIPPEHLFCAKRHRPTPYIFTDEEIQRLIRHARSLGPRGALRPHTYSTLFALLAVAGLRVSEALALRLQDLTPDGLVIRETKFRKSRLIGLHPSAVAALDQYLLYRRPWATHDDHLFVSRRGGKLGYDTVAETFREVLRAAGIGGPPGGPQPRLHALRHRFAVKALQACPDSREHITRHMLALSTYLGHARLESTYWYLESTPQLMSGIASACEAFTQEVMP